MRTEVKIQFSGTDIPGGVQAIFEATGCGPDVAIVEQRLPRKREKLTDDQIHMLCEMVSMFRTAGAEIELVDVEEAPAPSTPRRAEEATVTLDGDDERLRILLDCLAKNGKSWFEYRRDYYTDEELDRARLIMLDPQSSGMIFGGPRVGTLYDLKNACQACGAGARQTSALMIDGEALSRLEGLRVASTRYSDILVDERLAEELEGMDVRGLSFRSVYAVMKDGRQTKLRWRQLCAARTMPRISRQSTGVEPGLRCRLCDRSGVVMSMSESPRLAYRPQDVADIDDVMTTWEWFGDVEFNGDVREAIFPYPYLLITPKVMRVIRAAGPPSFDWLPVRIVHEE